MQIVSSEGDNLHDMSKPVVWEKMSSAEIITQRA